MKLKLYRQVTRISASPGDEKGCGDVSPKGHREGCRLSFIKADGGLCRAVRFGKGRSSPLPMPCELATAWVASAPDMGQTRSRHLIQSR